MSGASTSKAFSPPPFEDVDGDREEESPSLSPREALLLPDARDGLTRAQRIILWQLSLAQKERGDRNVPTAMLYGRVVEHISLSVPVFQRLLQDLVGRRGF